MDPQLKAELETLAADNFATYKAQRTEAQRALAEAAMNAMNGGNEEAKAERMAQFTAVFNESDADGNGRLDAAEYATFWNKYAEIKLQKGEYTLTDEAVRDRHYALANRITPGEEGISMADMGAMMQVMLPKTNELTQAQGL